MLGIPSAPGLGLSLDPERVASYTGGAALLRLKRAVRAPDGG